MLNCPAKQDGSEVVPVINQLIDSVPFDAVAYTLDWHPENHCSFIENINLRRLSANSPVIFFFVMYKFFQILPKILIIFVYLLEKRQHKSL